MPISISAAYLASNLFEVLELSANPNRDAQGAVIEARLDRGRGVVATVLIQRGTLHMGDIVICGSPDTVRKRIMECQRQAGFENFLVLLQFGTLPRDLTEKNIRLFSKEVLPAIQALGPSDYQGFEAKGLAAE